MRKDIEIGHYADGQDSHLWLAVAVSFTMIFTSYAVSVLNHRNGGEVSLQTQPNRPIVVSYLA
jgi:heme exporter protein D